MTDRRAPKKYPKGDGHPKERLTKQWLEHVRLALVTNRSAGRTPASASELARMIGADKSGLIRVLRGDQDTYKYTRQICDTLGIEYPTVDNPALDGDEWDAAVATARSLPPDMQRRALRILRAALSDTDS